MSEFKTYRATHKIHLPPPKEGHLELGEVVQFDGATLKRSDESIVELPQPRAIEGAIKAGWLVPLDSDRTYVPQASDMEVRSAQSTGDKRERVRVMTVQDEEQSVGSVQSVRDNADQNRSRTSSGSPTGAVVERDSDDGRVVGRFKTSAQSKPIEVGKDDQKVKSALDNKSRVEVERMGTPVRKAIATGDVEEARVGESLTDLLPDAESSGRPNATFQNDGVEVVSGGSAVGGQDDGVVVSKIGSVAQSSPLRSKAAAAQEKALRLWAKEGKTWDGKPVHLSELGLLCESVLESLDEARAELREARTALRKAQAAPKAEEAPPKPEAASDDGEFEWDLSVHWKTREMTALKEFGDDPETLRKILDQENSKGVVKKILARLEELGES